MNSKKPALPTTPTYTEDPRFTSGLSNLTGLGNQLADLNMTGRLSNLASTIAVDPNVLSGMFSSLQPYYNQMRQKTMNDLAANNQLESSVTANRLGQIDTDLGSTLQGQLAGLITQANQNKLSLFGSGLDTLNQAQNYAFGNQQSINDFNLKNYENQVAATLYNQKDQNGGLMGGLMGGAGGLMAGLALAPFTGGLSIPIALGMAGIGGAVGAMTPQSQGAGQSLFSMGSGMANNQGLSNALSSLSPARSLPGSTASSDPYGFERRRYGLLNNNPF